MDVTRAPLADRLAAEYVLGTLRGGARRRFETLLPAHPALQQAVTAWQQRLQPMSEAVTPVEPSPAVWAGVQRRLFGADDASAAQAALPWWRQLFPWQALAGVATVAALTFGLLLQQVPPPQPPIVVVLQATPDAAVLATQASTRFVASVSADGGALVLRPLADVPLAAGRALELWAVPAQGAPRSLGLVASQGATTVLRARLLDGTAAFAISVEPAGGSPTGAPTGPIVSMGELKI